MRERRAAGFAFLLLASAWTGAPAVAQGSSEIAARIALEYAGVVGGSYQGEKSDRDTDRRESLTFSWVFNWSAAGPLAPMGDQMVGGGGGTISGIAELRQTVHHSSYVDDRKRKTSQYDWDRECVLRIHDRAFTFSAIGVLEDGTLSLQWTFGSAPHLPDEWRCTGTEVQWTEHGGEKTTQNGGTGVYPLLGHAFLDENRPSNEAVFAEVDVALEGRTTLTPSYTGVLPAPPQSPESRYCPGAPTNSPEWREGTCTAKGTLVVVSSIDHCVTLSRRFLDFYSELGRIDPPDAGAPQAWVIAWGDATEAKVSDVLLAARQLLLHCGELPLDPLDRIVQLLRWYRNALLELHAQRKLDDRGAFEVIATERQLQLLGETDAAGTRAVYTMANTPPPPAGSLQARVHSPVALHAYDLSGAHVGWNASTNASEIGIPNASYEGAPGGAQRLSLPPGAYHIVVEELEAGPFTLVVWPEGAEGGEVLAGTAVPGRKTTIGYIFDDLGGGPAFLGLVATRTGGDVPSSADGDQGEETPISAALTLVAIGAAFMGARWARRR